MSKQLTDKDIMRDPKELDVPSLQLNYSWCNSKKKPRNSLQERDSFSRKRNNVKVRVKMTLSIYYSVPMEQNCPISLSVAGIVSS